MPQGGFLLTLSVPEGDKYHDDKADVLEVFGLEAERQFVLRADAEPGEDLLAYLRLINLQGANDSIGAYSELHTCRMLT